MIEGERRSPSGVRGQGAQERVRRPSHRRPGRIRHLGEGGALQCRHRRGSGHAVHEPAFCFVAQGSKQALLGEEVFRYDPGHYLIFTVDLPLVFQVEEASKERPYLVFRLNLDPSLVASVMMESGIEIKKGDASVKALDVGPTDTNLLDAVVRLVRLLDTPVEVKVLVPLITREIVFRLLVGGQGERLSHLLALGADTHRISKAIGFLRENFDQLVRMDDIAQELGMSVSGFHHHFKSVTSMSPLQFQKQVRLQEARRLMLSEDLDAATVAVFTARRAGSPDGRRTRTAATTAPSAASRLTVRNTAV